MKAIVQDRFGPPDVLQLVDTDQPARNIKRVDDAQFEIHCTATDGGDFTQVFSDKDIRVDKNAVLTLTNH